MEIPGMESLGKGLIFLGVFIVVVGILLVFAPKIPFLGKLPGDISIQTDRVSFYFPIVTSLVLSLLLTIIINIVTRIFGR